MSMTSPVEASIQAVSPESILASELGGVEGLVFSESASARTLEPVNNTADARNSASSTCFTGSLLRQYRYGPKGRHHRGEGSSANGQRKRQLMCRGKPAHLAEQRTRDTTRS